MSDQLLTPEELADMETGLTDGTIVYGRVLRRLIVSLRAAWAERDAVKRQLSTVQVELEAEHIRHYAIRAALGLEPDRDDDTVTQAVEIRAAAPVATGWVPVSLTHEPCWYRAAYTYDDAWLALITGEYYESRQQAEGAGWRVVPCAAQIAEEVTHDTK